MTFTEMINTKYQLRTIVELDAQSQTIHSFCFLYDLLWHVACIQTTSIYNKNNNMEGKSISLCMVNIVRVVAHVLSD